MSDKHPGGRPPHEPTLGQRNTVQVMVANGNGERVIARAVGIDRSTLRKHYREELRSGRDQVVAAMGAAPVRAGLAGNVHAAWYWLACRGGPSGARHARSK